MSGTPFVLGFMFVFFAANAVWFNGKEVAVQKALNKLRDELEETEERHPLALVNLFIQGEMFESFKMVSVIGLFCTVGVTITALLLG